MRFVRFLLGCALAGVLLWWLLRGVDGSSFTLQLRALPIWLWWAAPSGLLISYGLRAARVHSELGAVRPVRWMDALHVTLLHNAAVNLIPMRGGELAYPYLVHQKLGITPAESVASLLWMRLQDLVVLATLGLMLFLPLAFVERAGAAMLFIVIIAVLIHRFRRYASLRAAHWRASGPAATPGWRGRLRGWLLPVLAALADGTRHRAASWAYCIANWSLKLVVIAAILKAAGTLPLLVGLQGALGGELAALLPIQGPSGLGTYEAGVWAGVAVALSPAASLPVAALLAHGIIFGTAVLAGAVALVMGVLGQPRT